MNNPSLSEDTAAVVRSAAVSEVKTWLRREDNRLEDIFGLWVQGKRDDRWVAERLVDEGHIAALRAEAETYAALYKRVADSVASPKGE